MTHSRGMTTKSSNGLSIYPFTFKNPSKGCSPHVGSSMLSLCWLSPCWFVHVLPMLALPMLALSMLVRPCSPYVGSLHVGCPMTTGDCTSLSFWILCVCTTTEKRGAALAEQETTTEVRQEQTTSLLVLCYFLCLEVMYQNAYRLTPSVETIIASGYYSEALCTYFARVANTLDPSPDLYSLKHSYPAVTQHLWKVQKHMSVPGIVKIRITTKKNQGQLSLSIRS